jgi:hypothetical protein
MGVTLSEARGQTSTASQVVAQIAPLWLQLLDQLELSPALPSFQLPFSLNRIVDIDGGLDVHEPYSLMRMRVSIRVNARAVLL